MTRANLKDVMSILLIATGVLHLVVAAIGAPQDLQAPLAVFGAIYSALGVWVRTAGKPAVLAAMAATAIGLTLGGAAYLKNGGPMTLPAMFMIDIFILVAGGLWLAKAGERA